MRTFPLHDQDHEAGPGQTHVTSHAGWPQVLQSLTVRLAAVPVEGRAGLWRRMSQYVWNYRHTIKWNQPPPQVSTQSSTPLAFQADSQTVQSSSKLRRWILTVSEVSQSLPFFVLPTSRLKYLTLPRDREWEEESSGRLWGRRGSWSFLHHWSNHHVSSIKSIFSSNSPQDYLAHGKSLHRMGYPATGLESLYRNRR